MTLEERKGIYLCIIDTMVAADPECEHKDAGELIETIEAMTDVELVAFHDGLHRGEN
jgi:hypothetical protein